jgi:arylesterase/paraoxonase
MVNIASKLAIAVVVSSAVLYQFLIKHLVFDVFGYGREVTSIESYAHLKCERVEELGLEACEDMWLHEKTGYLYMACSDTRSRLEWLPPFVSHPPLISNTSANIYSIESFNASGRGMVDRIAVLDTRASGRLASRIQWLSLENFAGTNGDGLLNLQGMDIRADDNTDVLRILLVNHRPPIDPITGEAVDATKVGANSTIEQFQTTVGSSSMRHVRTYHHKVIQTPNNVAWVSDHSFVFTNDHTRKIGIVSISLSYLHTSCLTDMGSFVDSNLFLAAATLVTVIDEVAILPTTLGSIFPTVSFEAKMV